MAEEKVGTWVRDRGTAGDYLIYGIKDQVLYMTNTEGDWFKLEIPEDMDEWRNIPTSMQGTLGGAYLIGLNMLQDRQGHEKLIQVTDPLELREVRSKLGDS